MWDKYTLSQEEQEKNIYLFFSLWCFLDLYLYHSMFQTWSSIGNNIWISFIINFSASINNPLRSSLKKTKNKDNVSVASAASSKKSVRLALGEEQTAVWKFLLKVSKLKPTFNIFLTCQEIDLSSWNDWGINQKHFPKRQRHKSQANHCPLALPSFIRSVFGDKL